MRDIDIIRALKVCSNLSNGCSGCPLYSSAWDEYGKSIAKCEGELIRYALDLVIRQKSEIEILQKYNTDVAYKHYNDGIKEFAERLKQASCFYDIDNYHSFRAVDIDDIDDIVKEMTN